MAEKRKNPLDRNSPHILKFTGRDKPVPKSNKPHKGSNKFLKVKPK